MWPALQWGLGLQFRADGKEDGGRSVVSTHQSPFREVRVDLTEVLAEF